ncbi:hypothetical protein [Aquimarina algiphila]|uniref:Uncharacterized protein n=1 Tax=Aquimarina algiphila TaxID=2047982 RepID=A0A554VKA3_9FLAO|nr:hypothetical protein [Aquimarina algiphila]TSE08411.1 hypothetical protein FOF46_12710 [Aquimarina algiphila]
MKTDKEIQRLLDKVENLIERVANLKNPPDNLKMENFEYRSLLLEKYMYQWLLGDDGIDFDLSYNELDVCLNNLEKKQEGL